MENTFMLEFRYMIRCIELDAKHKYYSNTLQIHTMVTHSDTSRELHKHFKL